MASSSTPIADLRRSNTVLPGDSSIPDEDDATIQEVLNQIAGETRQQEQPVVQPPPQSLPPVAFQQQQQPQPQQNMPNMMFSQQQMYQPHSGGGYGHASQYVANPAFAPGSVSSLERLLAIFSSDLKLGMSTFVVVVFVIVLNPSRFFYRYIALEKIPYHDLIIKGVLISVAVVLIHRAVIGNGF